MSNLDAAAQESKSMPQMLTATDRQSAWIDRELAHRRAARLRRFLTRTDLALAARELALSELDTAEREESMLGALLSARTGRPMSSHASGDDTAEARPYQAVA